MSSILKALKKLEQEKALRKPDTFRIDADILRGPAPRRTSSARRVAAAVAMFACGVAATYFYLQPAQHPAAEKPVPTALDGARSVPVDTAKSGRDIAAQPAGEKPEGSAGTLRMRPEQAFPATVTSPSPARPTDRSPLTRSTKPAGSGLRPEKPDQTPSLPPAAAPAAAAAPARPVLKVHGIAFQDGADSMAMINGTTATKGSVIEGARVEEILKDRVRFSWSGEKIEILLERSN